MLPQKLVIIMVTTKICSTHKVFVLKYVWICTILIPVENIAKLPTTLNVNMDWTSLMHTHHTLYTAQFLMHWSHTGKLALNTVQQATYIHHIFHPSHSIVFVCFTCLTPECLYASPVSLHSVCMLHLSHSIMFLPSKLYFSF